MDLKYKISLFNAPKNFYRKGNSLGSFYLLNYCCSRQPEIIYMFSSRNKTKNSEAYKTLEARERWQLYLYILINLQDNSKMSCLMCLKLMRYKLYNLLQVDIVNSAV